MQQLKNTPTQDFIFPLKLYSCNTNESVGFICERPLRSEKRTQIQSPEIAQNETVRTDLYLTCPSGHVTHKFLSCDLQNFCWARHLSSTTICESPLSHVPPNFVCSSEAEQVPYPLVCDHRPDCRDYSDENFCVFPPCSATSFECGNKQVTMILSGLMMSKLSIIITMMMKSHDANNIYYHMKQSLVSLIKNLSSSRTLSVEYMKKK